MSITFRKALSLLGLSLSLITPATAQSQIVNNAIASSEVKDLAVALVRVKSETEQEQLLTQKEKLKNSSLLLALKGLVDPLVRKGEYNEALRISHLAVRIAETMGDRMQLATAWYELGTVYARRQPSKDGLPYLEKSFAIFEEAGAKKEQAKVFLAMAVAYENDRRRDQAIKYYEKTLALSQEVDDKHITARVYSGLGQTHGNLGNYEISLEFYNKARALSEEINDREVLHMALNNIGTYHTARGRYAEGLDYLNKGLRVLEELGAAGDRRSLALKLQNIGLIYRRQGQLDQALAYARRSLAIFEETDDKFGIANLQNNIGVIYKAQGQHDQAMGWFQKAMQGYEALKATPGIARCLNNIGDIYRLQRRYDEAYETLHKSLRLREQLADRGAVTLSLNNLGRLYQDQGKYREMLEVARRGAKLAEQLNDRDELWSAQERIGRALFALGQPAEARSSFLASIATVESLRREVAGGEQSQQSFLENRLSPWLGMIDLLVAENKHAEALAFAEQSKARVLLDTLQTRRSNIRQSWSKEEQQADEQHRQHLVALNSKLTTEMRRDKPDEARVIELKAQVEKARLEYEDFETRLYLARPELRVRRGEAPIIKRDELNALLPDASSALLEYVVGEDRTFLFVVTKGASEADVRLYTLPVKREDLAQQTETFRQQLAGRDLGFRAAAVKLYDTLLKPAAAQLRGKTNLTIAADNTLWDLPFQALASSPKRLLIEDAAIAYTPSLTVLREMTKRRTTQPDAGSQSLFALGNPSLGSETLKRAALTLRDGKLEPLPAAEQEVKALGRLYGETNSKVYIGAYAREGRVNDEASRARILNFATHGIRNHASPIY